jgi:hypothetical protein
MYHVSKLPGKHLEHYLHNLCKYFFRNILPVLVTVHLLVVLLMLIHYAV